MKIKALIFHTFRELFAKATLGVLAGISTLIILFMLLGLSSTDVGGGIALTMFGGIVGPPLPPDKFAEFVFGMQQGLANGMYAGLVLFGIFATAGVIPDMLEKGTVDLYLSKPIARRDLLLGKYLGAVTVMFANVLYFIGLLWIVTGIKLGVWNKEFLLSVISLTFIFACVYSIVTFLGVLTRNTAISIISAFLYLFIVGPSLFHREQTLFLLSTNEIYRKILDGMYYLLPQISGMQEELGKQIQYKEMNWKPFVQALLSSTVFFLGGTEVLKRKDF